MDSHMHHKPLTALILGLLGATLVTPALAATESATDLLTSFEYACQGLVPPSSNAVTADPGSALCTQLLTESDQIDRLNANDPQANAQARANFAAAVVPDESPALYTSLVQLSADQIRNVSHHLRNQRGRNTQTMPDTASRDALGTYFGGSAGDGDTLSRFSVFVDGAQVDGSQDQTVHEVGYDLETDHYTVGLDYRFNNALVAGFAYGNSDTTLKYSEAQNRTDNTTDHYILYVSWYRDNFAVDTVLAHARGEFDTRRNVLGNTATGNTDNSITYFSLSGAYDFVDGGFTYGTFASFDYLDGDIDAFEETNGGGWEVAFSSQDIKSQIYAMGGHVTYAASFPWGVLVPYLRAEWRTELEDERDVIVGRFVQDPASNFALGTDDPDSNWYQVSTGLSAQFPHGIAVFVDYQEVLEYEATDLSTVTLGVRWEL